MQREQQRQDALPGASAATPQPMQAGTVEQPVNPMPAQQLDKPGHEHAMALRPHFQAPTYRGSGKLDGQVALITGGDSGIGRAVAVLFAREGADVVLAYLNEHQDAEETRAHVEGEGRRCLLVPGDVCAAGFAESAVQQTLDAFGRIDVLINNAAFQLHAAHIEDLTDARFEMTLRTNVYGYFQMARAAVRHMRPGSAIINTGSVTGLKGSAQLLDYATTKGAIHAFTKALASQLLPQQIRVNAVAPGPVWTPLNPADRSGEQIQDFGSQTDMKRPAQPEEIAPAYVFLASPACSSYITGIVLPITGSVETA